MEKYKYHSSYEERRIADANNEARKLGISYGQYSALGSRAVHSEEKDIREKPNFWWDK